MLKKHDSTDKKVFLVSLHSSEVTKFNDYYRYIYRRIKDLDDEELTEQFICLKYFFNLIRVSIDDYKEVLKDFDFKDLNTFFSLLNEKDYKEDTLDILGNFSRLISNFRKGKINNILGDKLKGLYYLRNDNNAVISYKFPQDIQNNYRKINANHYIKSTNFYDNVFFIGSPNYYYNMNTIFKATNTYYLSYDIYRTDLVKRKFISDEHIGNSNIYKGIEIVKTGSDIESELNEANDSLPIEASYKFNKVINLIKKENREQTNIYTVTAKAVELASKEYILYPTNSKTVRAVDKQSKQIRSKMINEIDCGDWLIIKQSSDEEYIRERAAEIVGSDYENMFIRVTNYKKELINYMYSNKLDLVQLRNILSENNIQVQRQVLQHWMYGTTIAPREYNKILFFLNYDLNTINELENEYHMIRNAHLLAGRNLLKNLQKIIKNYDISEIDNEMQKQNEFDLEIPNIGKFCIRKVNTISSESLEVEYSKMYKVLSTN